MDHNQLNASATSAVYQARTYNLAEYKSKMRVFGRSATLENGITADWSCSGIEFVADCKGDVQIKLTLIGECHFSMTVDDVETQTLHYLPIGTGIYTIAQDLPEGLHKIRFLRGAQIKSGLVVLESIYLTGELKEHAAERKYVEFVGDSITAGTGITTDLHNGTRTYAYLLAKQYDFDYSMVAISGMGVSVPLDDPKVGSFVASDVYDYTSYYRSKTEKYVPEKQADLVVIALNTNDKGNGYEQQHLNQARKLLQQIKAMHGENVKILWVLGLMFVGRKVDLLIEELFAELGGAANNYYTVVTTNNNDGQHRHPSGAGQEVFAKEIADFIDRNHLLD